MADVAKRWGSREFWGVGHEYDPQWVLTDQQKELQKNLMEVCRTTLRPNAVKSDETYEFPRDNLNALAELGLLGILVPKSLGGLGENYQCATMVMETISRYGCPSTSLVYAMHVAATAGVLFRYQGNKCLTDLMSRLDRDKMVGTLAYSDPATGGHLWYPQSSKCWQMEDGSFKTLKHCSWATSAGFADWYLAQTVSPEFEGDYSNTSNFIFFKDEVRASTEDWTSLGMHGNQSGPIILEGRLSPERLIGPVGDGNLSNSEYVTPAVLLMTASCFNGIAMGSIDIAKKHVTTKTHADVGLRVCDYPTIQGSIGEAILDTNACRLVVCSIAAGIDEETHNNDWDIRQHIRTKFAHWCWHAKFSCAKNVSSITDRMLHVCGGSGYKTELGIERLLRDGKSAWLMAPSNEVLCAYAGKSALMGMDSLDLWAQKPDDRIVRSEMKKMTREQKSSLLQRLQYELSLEEQAESMPQTDTFDFDNPFSKEQPIQVGRIVDNDGIAHEVGINAKHPTALKLATVQTLTADEKVALYRFTLPNPTDQLGSVPGQFFEITIPGDDQNQTRFLSPTSTPSTYGQLDVVIKYETQGVLAGFLQSLTIGDSVQFRGPCGGFEYRTNTVNHISFICSGIGITPAIQIIRAILENNGDKTTMSLIYQAKTVDDLIFKTEIDGYATSKPGRLSVTYTLQEADDDWSGSEGQISRDVLRSHLAPPAGASGNTKHKVLICGGPHMVVTCLEGLLELRHKSEDIFIYGPFGAELLRVVYGRKCKLFQTL